MMSVRVPLSLTRAPVMMSVTPALSYDVGDSDMCTPALSYDVGDPLSLSRVMMSGSLSMAGRVRICIPPACRWRGG